MSKTRSTGQSEYKRLARLGEKYHAAWTASQNAVNRGEDYPDDFVFAESAIAQKIAAAKASSLAGLKIKAKVVLFEQGRSRIDLNDQATWDRLSWNERLIFSLIADICAMEG